MEFKLSEEARAKQREWYAKKKAEIRPAKNATRREYYARNRDVEAIKARIRYYRRTGNMEMVGVLGDELIEIQQQGVVPA